MEEVTIDRHLHHHHRSSLRKLSLTLAGLPPGVPDPYELPEINHLVPEEKKWKNLTPKKKAIRVLILTLKLIGILALLYCFVCSLSLLSSGFRLIGGRSAGEILQKNELLTNPVAGIMIGVLATVLLQSSSTTTSIIVTMVSAQILNVQQAVFLIMGANIGTSVTNTIVSLFHSGNRDEFRRAFAAATIHDMFNWLSVFIFLPLEVITRAIFGQGYLFFLSEQVVGLTGEGASGVTEKKDFLKVLTKPLTSLIVQLDKKTIKDIANGIPTNATILKKLCKNKDKVEVPCEHLMQKFSDSIAGIIILCMSLVVLCIVLMCVVKLLQSLLNGPAVTVIRKTVNADFPGCLKHLTGYFAIIVGAVMTFLVQSSSIFTSTLTPLTALGVITLDRAYPLTLGANIGTTGTAMIAAFAVVENFRHSVQIALCHLFFNISGILVWYPIVYCRKVPINLAKFLGNTTAKYRWFAVFYLILMFFLMPLTVFALSLAGWVFLLIVGVLVIILLITIGVVNLLQKKAPNVLPEKLKNWLFLPEFLRSLEPYDRVISKLVNFCHCCKKCKKATDEVNPKEEPKLEMAENGTNEVVTKNAHITAAEYAA